MCWGVFHPFLGFFCKKLLTKNIYQTVDWSIFTVALQTNASRNHGSSAERKNRLPRQQQHWLTSSLSVSLSTKWCLTNETQMIKTATRKTVWQSFTDQFELRTGHFDQFEFPFGRWNYPFKERLSQKPSESPVKNYFLGFWVSIIPQLTWRVLIWIFPTWTFHISCNFFVKT